ncbi:ubiquitin-like-conjugating enzyme ATG10 [Carlito syrichta]|uniref:Ubiquitin-like-conjugating enzyme ATG10 n=1 Tax=Carlito syrichta TaxID=1868482 RepID=A0A1U7THZ1_CARSF|nr:ubiquitin-like-conjugating enzyme ATG10 [Carlito syrichta]
MMPGEIVRGSPDVKQANKPLLASVDPEAAGGRQKAQGLLRHVTAPGLGAACALREAQALGITGLGSSCGVRLLVCYLHCVISLFDSEADTCQDLSETLELPPDDSEATETKVAARVVRYEYHVLHSCSYRVPVLYFRASFLDGTPLTLQDIWEGIHECYKTRLLQGPWDTITQQEHPILGQPFFVLHPCKTSEFMTPVVRNSRKINRSINYITSWLSAVGPVVGLHLPLSYARATSQDE